MKTRKTKTPHIQPEAVIKAALEILDAEGLENVTLRRIAAKLNVQAPAFTGTSKTNRHHRRHGPSHPHKRKTRQLHPTSRHQQLAFMAIGFNALPKKRANCSQRRRTRCCGSIVWSRLRFRKNVSSKVLNKAGFDSLPASLAAATIIDYVWGFVIEEQAGTEPPAFLSLVAQSGEYPNPYYFRRRRVFKRINGRIPQNHCDQNIRLGFTSNNNWPKFNLERP